MKAFNETTADTIKELVRQIREEVQVPFGGSLSIMCMSSGTIYLEWHDVPHADMPPGSEVMGEGGRQYLRFPIGDMPKGVEATMFSTNFEDEA